MASITESNTHYTNQVKGILDKTYHQGVLKNSLLQQAISYYENQPFNQHKLDELTRQIDELNCPDDQLKNLTKIEQLNIQIQQLKKTLAEESDERHRFISLICQEIMELSEGISFTESNRKSAKLLGTIQLLIPTDNSAVADFHQSCKPVYKAVLSLRLLDKLCIDGSILTKVPYIAEFCNDKSGIDFQQFQAQDIQGYQTFVEQVKIPLVMAALLQDIGHFHPEAQNIVCGQEGQLNPFRMLAVDDRKALLQINYRSTIKFLIEGLGAPIYRGNSKAERNIFNATEHKKLLFVKSMLKAAVAPKLGVGNILKVPQIYSSIILSTKANYNYKLLPKVFNALYQNAERGICCPKVVEALHKITGDFPMGYGITYIPHDEHGQNHDQYEYAIVTQLYPDHVNRPICRIATRNLKFISHGQDIVINENFNLHYADIARHFSSLSKERLNEISQLLWSNYQERKPLGLMPRFWHTYDYFSFKNNQKLWDKLNY